MTTVTETTYGKWGKCLCITDERIELLVTLDIGPRVIRCGMVGGGNFMFEDLDDAVCQKDNAELFKVFGDKGYWHIYGGHRLWTSPEALPRGYYPDNEPVAYQVVGNGARFTPPSQNYNNIQMEIEITLDKIISVKHYIKNIGPWEITFAPWALTVLAQGGLEVVPFPISDKNGLLADRYLPLWPYTNMSDPRVKWGERYITLRQNPDAEVPLKFGLNNMRGFALYFLHGGMFVKKYFPKADGCYPDGGVSFESYTNNHFIEMETLGELKSVAPGETVSHAETWEVFGDVAVPSNEDEIDAIVKQYV